MKEYGSWEASYHCVGCGAEISDNTRNYSEGICPLCGRASEGTFVDCDKRIRRRVYGSGNGRREAVEATRAQNSVFSFVYYKVIHLFRKSRPRLGKQFTWEYQKRQS